MPSFYSLSKLFRWRRCITREKALRLSLPLSSPGQRNLNATHEDPESHRDAADVGAGPDRRRLDRLVLKMEEAFRILGGVFGQVLGGLLAAHPWQLSDSWFRFP